MRYYVNKLLGRLSYEIFAAISCYSKGTVFVVFFVGIYYFAVVELLRRVSASMNVNGDLTSYPTTSFLYFKLPVLTFFGVILLLFLLVLTGYINSDYYSAERHSEVFLKI